MEEKEKTHLSVTVAVVLVLTGLTGAGYFYMWYEVGGMLRGLEGAGPKVADLRNSVLYYTFFMALMILGSIIFVTSIVTRKLKDANVRLSDKINLQDSQIDDLKSQLSAFEDRIKLKDAETEKASRVMDGSILDKRSGLFNREYFHVILPNEINRAKRDKKQLILVLIDIVGVNREQKQLFWYAGELKKCAKRAGDFSFHLDDDRFAVIFSGLSLDNSRRFIQFINDTLHQDEKKLPIQMGVAFSFAESLPESDDLYEHAKKAIAKASAAEPIIYEIIE